MIETVVYVCWDESGTVAAHIDADEAADLLDSESTGRFRRVLALTLTLPPAKAIEMELNVIEVESRFATDNRSAGDD